MTNEQEITPIYKRQPVGGCYPVLKSEWQRKLRDYKSGRATKDPAKSTGKMMAYDPAKGTILVPVYLVEAL